MIHVKRVCHQPQWTAQQSGNLVIYHWDGVIRCTGKGQLCLAVQGSHKSKVMQTVPCQTIGAASHRHVGPITMHIYE